jgi:hypothetical protein
MKPVIKAQLLSMKQPLRDHIATMVKGNHLDPALIPDAQFIVGEILRSVGNKLDTFNNTHTVETFMADYRATIMNLASGLVRKGSDVDEPALRRVTADALAKVASLLKQGGQQPEMTASEIFDFFGVLILGNESAIKPPDPHPGAQSPDGRTSDGQATSDSVQNEPAKTGKVRYYRGVRIE